MTTLFDDAVPRALEVARRVLGDTVELTLVRDVVGYVTVVVPAELEADKVERCARELDASLGKYSPGVQSVVLTTDDLVDPADVVRSPDRVPFPDAAHAFLVDRVLTNQDWIRRPTAEPNPFRLATVYSVKGGVGRTTALAVWARQLAEAGKHVVLVDLDLEAPGLAAILLSALPRYGLVDWLAEDLVGQPGAIALDDLLAPSAFADDTTGSIRVLPAFGEGTKDYVSKLGRVLVPAIDTDGRPREIASRLAQLLRSVANEERPDAILLDARAGLHDLGAAAVTQLGAKVFLFARDEISGWDAWNKLFEHLRRSHAIAYGGLEDDLRWRLKMVGAQAGPTQADRERLIERAHTLWTSLYDADELDLPSGAYGTLLTFDRADRDAPHYPLIILFDPALRGVDFSRPEARPDARVLELAFGEFCRGASAALFEDDGEEHA